MTALSELKRRVDGAEGPDRELDAHIRAQFFDDMFFCDFEAGSYHGECASPGCGKPVGMKDERRLYPRRWEDDERLPRYTASIDAAVALIERVLPGWRWDLERRHRHIRGSRCYLWHPASSGTITHKGFGRTPALAALSALLAAVEAQGGAK